MLFVSVAITLSQPSLRLCPQRNHRKKVMLERLGKVSGWVGTSFALLAFVFAFMKWSPGHGEPFYFGVLAAVLFFLIGQAVRYVLVTRALHVNRISSPMFAHST